MKIYMIHPRFSDSYWPILPWWSSPYHRDSMDLWNLIDVMGVDAYMPPTALVTLAAMTPADIEIEIVDNNAGVPINFDVKCDLVCITAYSNQMPEVMRITRRFQARGIPVALGGPHASTAPEECHFVNHLFVGEAEYTWAEFLKDFKEGKARHEYNQVDKVSMEDSPVPRWDLLDLTRYDAGILQTTRGCPFDCEYCDVIVFNGRKPRHKTFRTVLDDIRRQSEGGAERIFLSDDNFIGEKQYAKKLLKEIIELNKDLERPMQFISQLTINVAHDDELLKLLADANFTSIFIGVETPRKESLLIAQKPQNTIRDLGEDLARIGTYGMVPVTGLITGFDTDDDTIFQEQLDFINNVPLLVTRCNILTAIPHTQLWHRMKEEGRLVPPEVRVNDFTPMLPNYFPKMMEREQLYRGHLDFVQQVWSIENMEKRLIKYLQQVKYVAPVAYETPSPRQTKVVARLLRKLATHGDVAERRFFFKTLYHAMRIQPHAMRSAIFAYINGMASRNVVKAVLAREKKGSVGVRDLYWEPNKSAADLGMSASSL